MWKWRKSRGQLKSGRRFTQFARVFLGICFQHELILDALHNVSEIQNFAKLPPMFINGSIKF